MNWKIVEKVGNWMMVAAGVAIGAVMGLFVLGGAIVLNATLISGLGWGWRLLLLLAGEVAAVCFFGGVALRLAAILKGCYKKP